MISVNISRNARSPKIILVGIHRENSHKLASSCPWVGRSRSNPNNFASATTDVSLPVQRGLEFVAVAGS